MMEIVEKKNIKRYPTYKDSGVEWIGEVPQSWEKRNLQDISDDKQYSFTGGPFGSDLKSEEYTLNGVRIIQLQNIGIGEFLDDYKIYTSEEKANQLLSCNIFPGDIIIAKMADPVARACIMPPIADRFLMASDGIRLEVNANIVDKRFIVYSINSSYFKYQAELHSSGTTRLRIGLSTLKKLKILLPTYSEQTQIATYLDQKTAQIDTLIQKTEQKISLLQELRAAIINEAVTKGLQHLPPEQGGTKGVPMKDSGVEWIGEVPEHFQTPKMKYICHFILDGTHGSFKRVNEGYRLLSVRNIIDGKFVFRLDDSRISEKDFLEISSKFLIKPNDIQLAIVGATLGKVALVGELSEEFVTQRSLATIRANEIKCFYSFLYYFIKSNTFQKYLWQNAGFSAQPGVYLGTLQNSSVPLPSLEEQIKISNYLNFKTEEIDSLIRKEGNRIQLLQEYRQSLISEVVTGKICVLDEIPVP